jgi:uncharacterized membrane protein
MSRNSNNRQAAQYGYNRQSKGYQQNLYKQKLKEENIKAPKNTLTEKKLRTIAIVAGIVWLVLTIALIFAFKWWGLLAGLVIGLIGVGGAYLYLRSKQNEMIAYYKKLGMTEDMYINELKKRGTDPKQLEYTRKVWRRVKVD